MSFENQSFVVVGGASVGGIGLEFVKELFSIGVEKIAIFDVMDPSRAISELKSLFPNKTVLFYKVDVRNRSEIECAFKEVVKSFGYVDVLVNCAGIIDERRPKDTIDINLTGVINSTLTAIDYMGVSKGGHGGTIMNIASAAGLRPVRFIPVYCASKHGVVAFTRSLAQKELAAELGIKFILICPGFTDTTLLSNMESTFYGKNVANEIPEILNSHSMQTVSQCAKNMVEAMKTSENGSTWILMKGELKQAEL
ncbi:alcohol dehydrogenase 1-like [Contarinia nasturtii]|uniref:alcohol dehydrogenase 1-like n=1 Tax=Contarinia nasturtii TaxID=265458 RepID=UPI0012D4ABEB|nr:alcohol dehydrogenase 1-like [Contarinia nasturtii]XP_031633580.1 alcohol dehydrogenase 1-like [Contarinia nasturtii]